MVAQCGGLPIQVGTKEKEKKKEKKKNNQVVSCPKNFFSDKFIVDC